MIPWLLFVFLQLTCAIYRNRSRDYLTIDSPTQPRYSITSLYMTWPTLLNILSSTPVSQQTPSAGLASMQ